MSHLSKSTAGIIVYAVAVVLAGAVYYGYSTVFQGGAVSWQEPTETRESPAAESVSPAPVSAVSTSTTKQQGEKAATEPSFPIPDLNRPIKAYLALSPSAEESAKQNIRSLTELLRANPEDYSTWLFWGLYRKTLGDYRGAEEVWKYVSNRWPSDYVAYNNLGDLYHLYLKDYPKAEQYFLLAAKVRPDFVQTYFNLYDLYRYSYSGRADDAPRALAQGLQKNPGDLNLMIGLARYSAEFGDKESAARYYKMAINMAKATNHVAVAESLEAEARESGVAL